MPQFGIRALLLAIAGFALLLGFNSQVAGPIREANRIAKCRNNIRQICLALLNHESGCGHLPISAEIGPDGLKWHSWKSSIYPHFMETSRTEYDRSQPWNSAANRKIVAPYPYPTAFCCPSSSHKAVDYAVVIGSETAFPPNGVVNLSQITDGPENTILVVESSGLSTTWTEPKDLEFDSMSFKINATNRPSISGSHPGGANVGFADGACYFVTNKISESELSALLTIGGGENVSRKNLVERGVLIAR